MLRSWKVGSAAGLYDYLSEGEAPSLTLAADNDYRTRIQGEAWGEGAALMSFERGRNKAKTLAEVGMNRFAFNSLAKGYSPCRGDRLIQMQDGKHVPGFDHQFSPPKSVSIEAAFNDTRRADILAAHQRSVRAAFDAMEQSALVCRVPVKQPSLIADRATKTQGSQTRRTQGKLVAYATTHWTSRPTDETLARGYNSGDPQLHTHTFVFNVAYAEDKWRAVDHRGLVHTVTLAESVYQHQLAYELQKLGYQLEPTLDRQGRQSFELAGSHAPTRDFFSSRHRQVERRIAEFERGAGRSPNRTEMKELTEAFYQRTGRMPGSNERAEIARSFNEGHGRPPTELEEQQLARQGRLKKKQTSGEPDFANHRKALLAAGLPLPNHTRGDHFALHRAPVEQRSAEALSRALRQFNRDRGTFYRHQVEPTLRRAAIGHLTPDETTALVKRLADSDELVVFRKANDRSADELTTQSLLRRRSQTYEQAQQPPSVDRPVALQPPRQPQRHRPERMASRTDEGSVAHDRQSADRRFTPQQPPPELPGRQNSGQQQQPTRREVIEQLERLNVTNLEVRQYFYARWQTMTPDERERVVSTDARLAARLQPPEPDGVLTRRYWDQPTLDRWEKHWSNERSLMQREQQTRAEQYLQRERKTAMSDQDQFSEVRPLFSHAQQLEELADSYTDFDPRNYREADKAWDTAFKAAERRYGKAGVEELAQQYAFYTPGSRLAPEVELTAELTRRESARKAHSSNTRTPDDLRQKLSQSPIEKLRPEQQQALEHERRQGLKP